MKIAFVTWEKSPKKGILEEIETDFRENISTSRKCDKYDVAEKEFLNMSEKESLDALSKYILIKNRNNSDVIIFSTREIHFLAIRILVKTGLLKPDDVLIYYINKHGVLSVPEIDKDGRLDIWPDGLFQLHINMLSNLL